jgi:hypothetical protein
MAGDKSARAGNEHGTIFEESIVTHSLELTSSNLNREA